MRELLYCEFQVEKFQAKVKGLEKVLKEREGVIEREKEVKIREQDDIICALRAELKLRDKAIRQLRVQREV